MKLSVPDMGKDIELSSEEKINVLEELLTPLRNSVLVLPENIYTPTSIGVLSRYPWYDFLKDWLCLVQKDITAAEYDAFPFERFQVTKLGASLIYCMKFHFLHQENWSYLYPTAHLFYIAHGHL